MEYTINDIKYVSWSPKNQRIIDHLIEREIYCCMTCEVEYMISKIPECDSNNPFDENIYDEMFVPECPECGCKNCFEQIMVSELEDKDIKINNNSFACPICGEIYQTPTEAKECCGNDELIYRCISCGKCYSEDDYSYLDISCEDIFEWWAVSGWFGEKLREQGCVVIETPGNTYWGRTTTGQSISLDMCIFKIAFQMQILDGMANCWE